MKYGKTVRGTFLERPNRFIAKVLVEGKEETVHVKNTGRCRELLLPGSTVILEDCQSKTRKTRYDLISVYKEGLGLVNMDSQAPNKIMAEWLQGQGYDYIKPEYTYGNSRIDFYLEKEGKKYLMEVKGCTQEFERMGYFPDAPTERGVKHLRELVKAQKAGMQGIVAFVIQMEGVTEVRPNREIHPEFGMALDEAIKQGVKILFLTCQVREDEVCAKIGHYQS